MPVSSSRRRMPICETASIMLLSAGVSGKTMWRSSGSTAPKIDGPSSTPARSWPKIAGWPMRAMPSPISRPKNSSRISSAAKIAVVWSAATPVSACGHRLLI